MDYRIYYTIHGCDYTMIQSWWGLEEMLDRLMFEGAHITLIRQL